jgi:hypothetical protein
MWDQVSTAVLNILKANDLLANAYNFEAAEFDGDPVATLTPSANENDYATTTENRRTYGFNLRVYKGRLTGEDAESKTEAAMRELVDSVLDDLDKNHRLSAIDSKVGYTFLYLEAAPSQWGYSGRENVYRVAEIIVKVHFAVDVNLIT